MKNFCLDLREHATKIINYEKKNEMIPLTRKEKKMHNKQKFCYICKKRFSTDDNNNKYLQGQRPLSLYWEMQRCCSRYLQFKIKYQNKFL